MGRVVQENFVALFHVTFLGAHLVCLTDFGSVLLFYMKNPSCARWRPPRYLLVNFSWR